MNISGIRIWEFIQIKYWPPVRPSPKSNRISPQLLKGFRWNPFLSSSFQCFSLFLFFPQGECRQLWSRARLKCLRRLVRVTRRGTHTHCPHQRSRGSHRPWTSRLLCPPSSTIQSHWSLFWTPHLDCSTRDFQAKKKIRKIFANWV